jgi:O-antigen/teichoic acid export membrane protein
LNRNEFNVKREEKPEIHKEELAKVAKGAGITLVGKIIGNGVSFLYIVIVARFLGSETLGLFMIGLAISNFAGIIGLLGLDRGVIRYVAMYHGRRDAQRVKGAIVKGIEFSFITSIIAGAILFLFAGPLAINLFNKLELEKILMVLSLSIPFFSFMWIALSSTEGFLTMKYTVYGRNLFLPVTNLSAALLLFALGIKLYGIVAAYVISTILTSILSLYYLIKVFPDIVKTEAIYESKELLRFSIPLLSMVFFNFIVMWTDTLMLGYFSSSQEVGIYNGAMKIALLISVILMSFNSIFAPMLSGLYSKKEMGKIENLFKNVTKWIYTISLPVFLLILLLSEEILSILGSEFISGRHPLIILALAQLINAGVGSTGVILIMSGKQNLMMVNTVCASLVNIILNYLLIPPYGMTGAAIATGITMVGVNIAMMVEIFFLFNMHAYNSKYIKPTLSGAAAFGITFFLGHTVWELEGIAKLLIHATVFSSIFIFVIYKCGIDDDAQHIFGIIKIKFQKLLCK